MGHEEMEPSSLLPHFLASDGEDDVGRGQALSAWEKQRSIYEAHGMEMKKERPQTKDWDARPLVSEDIEIPAFASEVEHIKRKSVLARFLPCCRIVETCLLTRRPSQRQICSSASRSMERSTWTACTKGRVLREPGRTTSHSVWSLKLPSWKKFAGWYARALPSPRLPILIEQSLSGPICFSHRMGLMDFACILPRRVAASSFFIIVLFLAQNASVL